MYRCLALSFLVKMKRKSLTSISVYLIQGIFIRAFSSDFDFYKREILLGIRCNLSTIKLEAISNRSIGPAKMQRR